MTWHGLLQETFHIILRIDDIKIFIHCLAKDVEDISKLKKKQGRVDSMKTFTCLGVENHKSNRTSEVRTKLGYFTIADRYFMQYMGAFYANSVAGGLIENKMCTMDSSEVLLNVAHLRDAEENERQNRAVAVDGLLSMNQMQKTGKKKHKWSTKNLDPIAVMEN